MPPGPVAPDRNERVGCDASSCTGVRSLLTLSPRAAWSVVVRMASGSEVAFEQVGYALVVLFAGRVVVRAGATREGEAVADPSVSFDARVDAGCWQRVTRRTAQGDASRPYCAGQVIDALDLCVSPRVSADVSRRSRERFQCDPTSFPVLSSLTMRSLITRDARPERVGE